MRRCQRGRTKWATGRDEEQELMKAEAVVALGGPITAQYFTLKLLYTAESIIRAPQKVCISIPCRRCISEQK